MLRADPTPPHSGLNSCVEGRSHPVIFSLYHDLLLLSWCTLVRVLVSLAPRAIAGIHQVITSGTRKRRCVMPSVQPNVKVAAKSPFSARQHSVFPREGQRKSSAEPAQPGRLSARSSFPSAGRISPREQPSKPDPLQTKRNGEAAATSAEALLATKRQRLQPVDPPAKEPHARPAKAKVFTVNYLVKRRRGSGHWQYLVRCDYKTPRAASLVLHLTLDVPLSRPACFVG